MELTSEQVLLRDAVRRLLASHAGPGSGAGSPGEQGYDGGLWRRLCGEIGVAGLGLRAAAARAWCSEALLRVAGQMIQLHGAIGITWEHDAHRYFKRAHGAGQLFGAPSVHLARIATALLDC